MQQLVWNDELARIAQTWADQCDCVFQENQVNFGLDDAKASTLPEAREESNFPG